MPAPLSAPVDDPPLTGPAAFAEAIAGRPYLADDLDALPPIPERWRELFRDRLEAAWAADLLAVTPDQFAEVLVALMPEDFLAYPPDSPASPTLAGTAERVADYADRATHREPVLRAVDGAACRGGVRVKQRRNRNGRNRVGAKVLGEAGPGPRPAPAGMYRDARGCWFELG